jgi:hypothetical protein
MAGMDRLSFLIKPEYGSFLGGAFLILVALLSAYFGVCPGRYGRTYRAKDPKSFWFGVSIYLLFGVLLWINFWHQSK